MKTVFSLGPGWFWSEVPAKGSKMPRGRMRIHCARLESYDLDEKESGDMDTTFQLLVAQAEGNPSIARVLLKLHESLGKNLEQLKQQAK